MSNVRAEVLRVSRSRTGWRDGGVSGAGGNNSTGSSSTTTSSTPSTNAGQIQYISSLKSTFEGSTNGDSNITTPQETRSPMDAANFRPQRHGIGTKVSTIANMFQSMAPIVHAPLGRQPSAFKVESSQNGESMRTTTTPMTATVVAQSPEVHKTFHHHPHHHHHHYHHQQQQQQHQERRPSLIVEATSTTQAPPTTPSGISVHLNRTESQVARFNSARAMFERLEEKIIQTSKAGSVSPRRSAFSPTLYSRSPSPVCSQTQSVGCSPKRGSPLSPREKSRSEDNIIMSDQPSAIINRDSIVMSSVDGSGSGSSRNSTSSSSYCSSSHVNNGRGGHNMDFDLTCSGAGEAIVSPGPLSPHLARYLAEDLLAMTAAPKCVGAEEKASTVVSSSSKSPTKPSPLCPKPADLMFAVKTPVMANKRAAGGTKRDDGSSGGVFSRRSVVHSTAAVSAVTTPPDQVVGAHIPAEEANSDERPILIGVVEKKTMISQASPLHSDISAAMCNGRVSSRSSSDRPASETVLRPSAVQSSVVDAQNSVTSPSIQERAIVVVEATNQQLLREVQGAFNRGTSSASSESGSQILVLSSDGKSFEHEDPVVLVTSSTIAAVNQPADSAARAILTESPTAISRTLPYNHSMTTTTTTTTTPVVSRNRSQSTNENGVTQSPKTNSTASLSPAETGTSSSLLFSPQLDSNDGFGFSSQGTSPLSPKVECGEVPLKADVSQNLVNGALVAKSKSSVQQSFPTGSDVKRDFPELMTPEEANRLLSSSDDHGDDVEPVATKTPTKNSWFDDGDVMEDQEETPSSENDVERGEHMTLSRDDDDNVDERFAVTTADCKERLMHEEDGVHIYEDGHFWLEIPGLLESDNEEVLQAYGAIVTPKRRDRVKFSTKPIRVYSTFSVSDYDRRNDDVDPVSASAEYELEKRVEKMDVFPVELMKGPEGLGLSIIGMGVGADAGLEKLGIFVKTITDGGAAFKDGRIDVNDQIIEVDGKSLVGVTQAYAASVLRNTSGLVRFSIGRERDGENSEVAQLISQSLQADREREYRRKNYEQETTNQQRSSLDGGARNENAYPGLTLPIPSLSVQPSLCALDPRVMGQHQQEDSTPEEGEDEPTCEVFDLEGSSESASPDSTDARIKLNEVTILERLQSEREEYEKRIRMLTARLAEVERIVDDAKDEVAKYQNMLEESQGQYIVLEKKYYKAKKLIKESQQREQDLLHREDYHIQQLEEKDQEYNALVKSLKDRVIQLEQELMETQRAAGLPVKLPYDNTSIKQLQLTPQLLRRPPPSAIQRKRTSSLLDTDISDSELADSSSNQFDISPDSDDMETKTSTVERKPLQAKDGADLFEKAVPQHELLDSTAAKTKAELASKLGSLANRQPPSLKKTSSSGSSGDGMPFDSRDSDSNDTSLGSSREDLECADPVIRENIASSALLSTTLCSSAAPVAATTSLPSPGDDEDRSTRGGADQQKMVEHRMIKTTRTTVEQGGRSGSPVRIDGKFAEEIRIILERKSIEAKRQAAASLSDLVAEPLPPLASSQEKSAAHSTGYAHLLLTDAPRNMTPSPMSTVSSRSSSSNTTGGSDHGAVVVTGTAGANRLSSASAAVLHSLKRDSPISGNVRLCPQSVPPFTCCCCLPGTALHIAEFTMSESIDYPDELDRDARGSAPSIIGDHGGGGGGVVTQAGTTNVASDRRPHQWHSCSVSDWSSGQVGQWLLALSMEQYISVFMDNNVGGQELLNMDSAKLKNMGVVNSNDRSLLKRRVKDLKALVEKERKAHEKEMRTKEKIQKKAERAAEKAVKRK